MARSLRFSKRCASRPSERWLRDFFNHPVRLRELPSFTRRGVARIADTLARRRSAFEKNEMPALLRSSARSALRTPLIRFLPRHDDQAVTPVTRQLVYRSKYRSQRRTAYAAAEHTVDQPAV